MTNCSNCGEKLINTDPKKIIYIHGITGVGSGISFGGRDFVVSPSFCNKECACKYFSNASDVINDKCDSCGSIHGGLFNAPLSCDDIRCPYVLEGKERERNKQMWDRVVKRDGGIIKHVLKTCKKFYFG